VNEHAILPIEMQAIAVTVLVTFLVWVVQLIRAQRLSVRDSLAWLLTTVAALAVTLFPSLLVAGARLVGVQIPSNAIFGAGLLYVGFNVLSVTITASANADRTRRLTQECALLRAELDALRAAVGRPPPGDAPRA
jgi:hypothetical protein